MGRNHTGPLSSVGRLTAHALGPGRQTAYVPCGWLARPQHYSRWQRMPASKTILAH